MTIVSVSMDVEVDLDVIDLDYLMDNVESRSGVQAYIIHCGEADKWYHAAVVDSDFVHVDNVYDYVRDSLTVEEILNDIIGQEDLIAYLEAKGIGKEEAA